MAPMVRKLGYASAYCSYPFTERERGGPPPPGYQSDHPVLTSANATWLSLLAKAVYPRACADRMPNALLPKDKKPKPRSRTDTKPNGHKAERT